MCDQFEDDGYPDHEAVLAHAGLKIEGAQVEFNAQSLLAVERDALIQPGR